MPVRIYDISKKLGLGNKEVLAKAKELGIVARVASSTLDKITAEYLEDRLKEAHPELSAPPPPAPPPPPPSSSYTTVPGGTPTTQSAPRGPCIFWGPPARPGPARWRGRMPRKDLRLDEREVKEREGMGG